MSVDVVIVGGGIAGMSTAWYVQEKAPDLSYLLLEASDRWGGKIDTVNVDVTEDDGDDAQFVVEGGPDSFITQKPWGLELARELGLDDDLLPTNNEMRKVYVLNKGKPTPLPDGVLLIVPTKFTPFAMSTLISPAGKLRMGMDLFIPAKTDDEDETLAQFIQRRLGDEALDKIAEPLMSGIYNAEAEMQSVMATFPRFRAIEKKHGSLIKGMLAARKSAPKPPPSNGDAPKRPSSVFMSLKGGMTEMVTTLSQRLTGDCRLNTAVQSVTACDGGYCLTLNDGSIIQARHVVMAVPAFVAAQLLADCAPDAIDVLNQIRYVSTGTVSLAFRRSEIELPYNGFGLVIPRSEGRNINAITLTSTKFNHRAPEGYVLLRVFFGGSRRPEMMEHDDDLLLRIVRQELRSIMGITADPLFHRIFRWHRSNPQYDVGHLDRVAAIEAALPFGLYVTGSPYGGVGIPDCIHQSQMTVDKLIATQT